MIKYEVPFYPNLKSGSHCFQACLKMVLKYFQSKKNYSWKQLEAISAKEKDMWTWPLAGILWLKNNSFDVIYCEPFDYTKFATDGKKYLIELFGQEVADEQEKHSILGKEQKRAKEFVKKIKPSQEIPEIADIKNFLKKGYLVKVSLNSATLNRKRGYSGHSVLIIGYGAKKLILHDPGGYPGKPNREVSIELFEKAWAYPNEKAKNIIAIRLATVNI